MASQERGMSPPIPGVGEGIRKIVNVLKNRGQHGITQAGVIAPEKPKTGVPSDLTQEELKQLIPPSPESSKEPPKNKKPWIKRKVGILTTGISLAALAAAGAGYAANEAYQNNIPALSRSAETAPFDNNLLDVKPQTIVLGQNARYATPEEIQNTIEGPQPKAVAYRAIEAGETIPTTPLILSIGENAGKIKIYRTSTAVGMNGKSVDIPMNLRVSLENNGTLIGLVIPEGINTNEGEVFLAPGPNNTIINGRLHFTTMYIKYVLGNGEYIKIGISSNAAQSFIATDFLKDAPTLNPTSSFELSNGQVIVGQSLSDLLKKTTGKKFRISDNPALFVKTAPDDLNINISSNAGYMLAETKIENRDILIGSPR